MGYNYTVKVYYNGISVITKRFIYKERMEIVLNILSKYYNPDDIYIEDTYLNKTRLTNYY